MSKTHDNYTLCVIIFSHRLCYNYLPGRVMSAEYDWIFEGKKPVNLVVIKYY